MVVQTADTLKLYDPYVLRWTNCQVKNLHSNQGNRKFKSEKSTFFPGKQYLSTVMGESFKELKCLQDVKGEKKKAIRA